MDYEKVTMKDYMDKKLEVLNSIGRTDCYCWGITNCDDCPLGNKSHNKFNMDCDEFEMMHPIEAIKVIMNYKVSIDWSNVKVDDVILVQDHTGLWVKRHFAEYKNGSVYVWGGGRTSHTATKKTKYENAKLLK